MFDVLVRISSGVGVFVFAIYLLNVSLSKGEFPQGNKIKNNPLRSFFIGMGSSILAQSSSVVNSITVQLSDRDAIGEKCAYYVVMGANIGTTATAYIAVLNDLNLTKFFIFPIFFSSLLLMILKKERARIVCFFVSVLSLIFLGLSVISHALPDVLNYMDYKIFAESEPFVLLLISLLLTALCQSSSLISVIIVALSGLNILPIEGAVFMIIGANIGTCSTALLVSVGKSRKGLNVALFNLTFNLVGLAAHVFAYYTHLLDWFINLSVAADTKTALYHTFFNVSTALLVFPFVGTDNSADCRNGTARGSLPRA